MGIFTQACILIAFRRLVNMKIVERIAFQPVRVLVALSIVASQPEHLRRLGNAVGKDGREIELVELTLSQHNAKLASISGRQIQFPLRASSL